MLPPGPNDPCPCGSGRRFKQCCGAEAELDSLPTPTDREAARGLLERLSGLPIFEADIAAAYATIWSGVSDEEEVGRLMETSANDLFIEWIWFDHQLHTGQTLAEYALASHPADLGPGGRRFLLACIHAPLRLLQVDHVEAKTWVHARDIVDGETIAVSDYAGSDQLFRQDVMAARIARYGDTAQFEGMTLLFDVQDKLWIAEQIQRRRELLGFSIPPGSDRSRMMRAATGAAILQSAIALFERAEPLIASYDGVLDPAIENDPGSESDAAFERDSTSDGDSAVDGDPDIERDPVTGRHDAVESDLDLTASDQEALETYYREWLDTPVPALGLRTPREAAEVKHLRAKLLALVETIENQAEHETHDGRVFDVSYLRSALGLE